jgi:hypothetical protein
MQKIALCNPITKWYDYLVKLRLGSNKSAIFATFGNQKYAVFSTIKNRWVV